MATSNDPPNAESGGKNAKLKKHAWDKWESFSRIIAGIGIPVVLGAGSWFIQAGLAQQSVSKEAMERLSDKRERAS